MFQLILPQIIHYKYLSNFPAEKPYDNVLTNLGSADNLPESVCLSWEDINVFVDRSNGKCCGPCARGGTEGDVLHIIKKGTLPDALMYPVKAIK